MVDYLTQETGNAPLPTPIASLEIYEKAKVLYPIMKALEWRQLPESGGLLEQEDGLMQMIAYMTLLEKRTEESMRLQQLTGGATQLS